MDRISALRNIEDAIRDLESGEADLASTERRVVTVLRTFATEFESDTGDETLEAWKAVGDDRAEGIVVLAATEDEATTRVQDLLTNATDDGDDVSFSVERV
ncbi:hypothetical protein E6P09_04235 [Haloferax mediterranei ATCC 33500]|uniref:Uncharacterized protein n=1 Tax=Haloferax mediterranei (strain ATCC 33500 / DSM 1411 / JCM 8866 / NBRC 14739 / NCIMB 2177 / R-4) TaxID=523841 RepID=I3R156_HALMT|nr:hypothetical protein [Haloferax mediterranei]AFK17966.1 hypothetical protein HFX_0225 [Haloferax mediterranei ATCC 33500]AHZ22612.1 hypothetical protein BM92_08130 [Haloferax mediterranei ATCC 33500]EMA02756.1 hypothetical protein C439_09245 [Haloferax mediterranei ATCC 33500]MDX5988059.1 hypothetical protein [Haloferax mediterranei ATCC 33500]QCQ74518.1 hypothetical protein E6P09_04235 [Haloferax mediterranei ATCC 33500]